MYFCMYYMLKSKYFVVKEKYNNFVILVFAWHHSTLAQHAAPQIKDKWVYHRRLYGTDWLCSLFDILLL